jgi:hypothetical protein
VLTRWACARAPWPLQRLSTEPGPNQPPHPGCSYHLMEDTPAAQEAEELKPPEEQEALWIDRAKK